MNGRRCAVLMAGLVLFDVRKNFQFNLDWVSKILENLVGLCVANFVDLFC